MHLAARRVGTVNTRGRADVAGLGQEAVPPEGDRQRPRRVQADEQAERRRRRLRPPQPRLPLQHAQEGRPGGDPDGDPLQVPGQPGARDRRPGPGCAQDQDRSPRSLKAIRRPDLTEAEATEAVGESKATGLRRTLDRRTILIGLPGPRPGPPPQRPQHRRGAGRPGRRLQHLRRAQAALPAPDPRGARRPQGTGQGEAGPPPGPDAAKTSREGELTHGDPPPRPELYPQRAGAGAVPGRPPPADHREGHAPLGAAQRLHLRGQPAGHQDRDQARGRDAFNVKVADVRTQNRRGKVRRYRLKVGRMRNWKKAIVALHDDYRIDFY